VIEQFWGRAVRASRDSKESAGRSLIFGTFFPQGKLRQKNGCPGNPYTSFFSSGEGRFRPAAWLAPPCPHGCTIHVSPFEKIDLLAGCVQAIRGA